jgi:ribonuclease HII
VAGVDEAGRGPLAGPVVAGAVILKRTSFKEYIDDSKKLTALQRARAYKEILRKGIVSVGVVGEKTIDSINILRATRKAMEIAIANLQIPPDYVIVDGNVKLKTACPVECIIKGDTKSLSIAAASIIAKVTRDTMMERFHAFYPQYGFARHKGYPTKGHKAALKAHGPSPVHRRSFHPVKSLI